MDVMLLRMARKHGCQSCMAFCPRRTVDGDVATEWGECRLAPPSTSSQSRWPGVRRDDFCGEFQPVDEMAFSNTGKLVIGRAI